jgi:hypothetical protein
MKNLIEIRLSALVQAQEEEMRYVAANVKHIAKKISN